MELIDTHTHLYDGAFSQDIKQVLARSAAQGVVRMYLPNIDTTTIEPLLALEAQYPTQCAAMMGLHPCYVTTDAAKQLQQMEQWLQKHAFAAIGEIGLDLHHRQDNLKQQTEAFVQQLRWGKQYRLPVVIHSRAAFSATIQLLQQHQDGSLQGIFHCFGGSVAEAQQVIDLGFYLGIGGLVTFKNSSLRHTLAHIPLDHLVLETDSPYLAPVPHRGQRNEPSDLPCIAEQLATIYQVDVDTVARITTANAQAVLG